LTWRAAGPARYHFEGEAKMGNTAPMMEPENFIIDLNKTVWYMLRRGATFFFPAYLAFMGHYIMAWKAQNRNQDSSALIRVTDIYWIRIRNYNPITKLLGTERIPLALRQFTITFVTIPLIFFGMSVLAGRGFYRMIRSSIRSVPPLLTTVVVVFVTSDAWRILGTGFSARPIALWVAFIIAAWLFLIRYKHWADIKVDADMQDLMRAAESKGYLNSFVQLGAVPQEMEEPDDRAGRQFVYSAYMVLTLLSLLEVALAVAATLTVVGMILVSKSETNTLANGVHVYFTLPGHVVLTTQLVSLSITLGCFAAFFLVAGQRPKDRKKFMNSVLKDLRRVLLAYSIYRRACTSSAAWTLVLV
jgi:hypothetical protein